MSFFSDRDLRGRPAEFLLVEYFNARGIPAHVNDAPEEDRAGRASHDIVVAGEGWDVKTDWIAGVTKRIFVERSSLEHTQSYRFAYFIPNPYGFDIRIFTTKQLMELYNEPAEVNRGDGTTFQLFKYKHGVAGDQAGNEGVFIPMDVVKQVAQAPWQVLQELRQAA
jgi:hypothetical protein